MRRDGTLNEAGKISFRRKLFFAGLSFAGGLLYAASLPPLNLSFAVLISLCGILTAAEFYRWRFLFLCGWLWGVGWAIFAFRFLREIEPCLPWLLAPVIALWPALWAAWLPFFRDRLLLPAGSVLWNVSQREDYFRSRLPFWRITLYCFTAAASFTLLEWTRSRLFVWNDFSVTQWRNLPLIQIAAWTGSYGVGFLVASANTGFFALYYRKRGIPAFSLTLLLWAAAYALGWHVLSAPPAETAQTRRIGLVQCNLSQRRTPTPGQAQESLLKTTELSRRLAEKKPDLILWPECAVPAPYHGQGAFCAWYRREVAALISATKSPMLIGALDYSPDGKEMTNSALLFDASGALTGKYDKIHRVPFGEYVPFRQYLPDVLIRRIDMGRDLHAGNDPSPLEIWPGCRAGVAICYEGVFGYLTRETARRGADFLIVLSNDAWYPESSEPEQHLANAVLRCVETSLPMVRCGNNGGSGVVTAHGEFTQYAGGSCAGRPELRRETAVGVVTLHLPEKKSKSFYVRYGEWFPGLLALSLLAVLCYALRTTFRRAALLRQAMQKQP